MPDKKSDNNLGLSALTNTNNESIRKYKNIYKAKAYIPPSLVLYEYIRGKFLGIFPPFEHIYIY